MRRNVELTSLRATARDVGISPSGLNNLISDNSVPYRGTLHRVREWYARSTNLEAGITPESALAAANILLYGVSGHRRSEADAELLHLLRRYHAAPIGCVSCACGSCTRGG